MPTHKFKIGQTVFIKPSFSPKCPKDAAGSRCCEIRLLDYIEGVGQPLGYYAGELRRRGWKEAIIACHTMALRPTTSRVSATSITGERLALSVKRRSRTPAPARR